MKLNPENDSRSERPAPTGPKIVFMHIPKTGGTSLDAAIGRAYRAWGHVEGKGVITVSAASSAHAASLIGMRMREYRQMLLLYFLALKRSHYVRGHFGFSETAHREFGADWRFITLLRDPVDRWFSEYFYNRYKEGTHTRVEADLETYLESSTGRRAGEAFVRHLSERFDEAASTSPPSPEQAIANLEKFALVGCLEVIAPFVRDLERLLRVRLEIPVKKAGPISLEERNSMISQRVRDRVHELCRKDLVVYEHVLARAKRALR